MKKTLLISGIIVVAALVMGLPYILRNISAPASEPTSEPSPTVPSVQETTPTISEISTPQSAPVTSPATKALTPSQPSSNKSTTQQPTQPTTQTPPNQTLTIPQTSTPVSVTVGGFKFSPQMVTVKKGTKVTWTNNDAVGHTVTGDNGGPASSLLNQGAAYSYTFDKTGTYAYHCSPHPFMTATIEVIN